MIIKHVGIGIVVLDIKKLEILENNCLTYFKIALSSVLYIIYSLLRKHCQGMIDISLGLEES